MYSLKKPSHFILVNGHCDMKNIIQKPVANYPEKGNKPLKW